MDPRAKWGLGGLIAGLAALGAVLSLRAGDPAELPAEVRYKELTVERGRFRIAVAANGLVRPIDRIELKSKASGQVVELPIEVGDPIAQGGLIAQLDQVEERAALAQAQADLDISRAELELAEKNFERREKLFSSDVISKEAQDQTELGLAVARSKLVQATTALQRARERMEDTVITSPVDGVVLQRYVARGQIIASGVSNVGGGTPIADVADMSRVHIEAGVDEIDIGKVRVDQQASVRAEAFPDQVYRGQVVRIAPEARVEQNVTRFDVVVEVENTDGNLKSGMNAIVEIVIVDEPDVLTIPLAALQRPDGGAGGEGPPLALVRSDGGYQPRPLRTGRSDQRSVEVLDGLQEGDVVGIPMLSRLKDEHDQLDARMRDARSFGAGAPAVPRRPAGGS